jgi:hypothetical protein
VRRYGGGETTQQVGKRYGISKTRVASIPTRHGVPIRRQGLNEEQVVNGAAGLYVAGKSLGGSAPSMASPIRPSPPRFGGKMLSCGRDRAGSRRYNTVGTTEWWGASPRQPVSSDSCLRRSNGVGEHAGMEVDVVLAGKAATEDPSSRSGPGRP